MPDDLSTRVRRNSPAALTAQLRETQFSLRRLVVPAIGLVASVSISLAVVYWNMQADEREFDAVANNHRQILSDGLRKYEDKIVALRAFFDAADHEISRKEFEVFANELVEDAGAIEALSWIPRVGRDDRTAFELGAVKGGIAGYHITSFGPDGKPAPSEEREEYFPILYSVVPSRAIPIYGMDLGSEPMRHETLDRARDTGSFAATPILELKTGLAGRHGFFIVLPVFRQGPLQEKVEDRQRNLMGFVQGVFQLDPLVESILHNAATPERMDLYVFAGRANGAALPLHIHSSRLRTAPAGPRSLGALEAETHWSGELAIAGVQLTMVAVPFSSRGLFMRHFGALAILAAGLLLTGLNQFYITRQRRTESALVESEGRLNAIFGAAADGIALADAETKRVRMVNAAMCRMFGYSREEMLELSVADFHPQDDLAPIVQKFERQAKEKTDFLLIELPVKRKDGSVFFAQANTSSVRLGGKPCLVTIFRDITEAKADRENLKQAHEHLLSSVAELQRHEHEMRVITEMNDNLQACNSTQEAYLIAAATAGDLFPGTNGALAVVASRMLDVEVVAQWGADQPMLPYFILDDCWAMRTGQMREANGAGKGAVCQHFKSAPSGPYLCLPLTVHGETTGLLYLNLAAGSAIDEDLRRLLLLFGDVIKLSLSNLRLRDTLREQATRDPLTGLFNRRYLDETLARELSHATRRKEPLSIAMLDIDHFKMFNDENGHEAGDEVLKAVGEILRNFTRASDIACRFGGEEFILVLSGADSSVALSHVEQICQEIKRKQVGFRGTRLPTVTVSAGLVQSPENGASPQELLRAVDKALYAAKNAGRDRVVTSLAD